MATVYASIGTNIERRKHVQAAIDELSRHYGLVESSSVYETPAEGFDGDPFYNLVSRFQTDEPAAEVNRRFKEIEERWGRERGGEKFSARTLDIDLILYGDLIINEEGLKLPRDEIEYYAFVLEPLVELEPQGLYTPTGETFVSMWDVANANGQMKPAHRLDWIPTASSEQSAE